MINMVQKNLNNIIDSIDNIIMMMYRQMIYLVFSLEIKEAEVRFFLNLTVLGVVKEHNIIIVMVLVLNKEDNNSNKVNKGNKVNNNKKIV